MSGSEIHLWWFRMPVGWPGWPGAEQTALALLNRAELTRFHDFDNPAVARFFAYRRAARRLILAEVVGVRPECLVFKASPGGRPCLADGPAGLDFSTTDSGTTGALAIRADGPVGVDLELERLVDANRLAERVLSPAERAAYLEVPPDRRAAWILAAWTAKEALVKAMGMGLDLEAFRRITLSQTQNPENWRPAEVGSRLARRGRWQVCFRSLPGGALTAVAASEAIGITVIDAAPLLARHGLG